MECTLIQRTNLAEKQWSSRMTNRPYITKKKKKRICEVVFALTVPRNAHHNIRHPHAAATFVASLCPPCIPGAANKSLSSVVLPGFTLKCGRLAIKRVVSHTEQSKRFHVRHDKIYQWELLSSLYVHDRRTGVKEELSRVFQMPF